MSLSVSTQSDSEFVILTDCFSLQYLLVVPEVFPFSHVRAVTFPQNNNTIMVLLLLPEWVLCFSFIFSYFEIVFFSDLIFSTELVSKLLFNYLFVWKTYTECDLLSVGLLSRCPHQQGLGHKAETVVLGLSSAASQVCISGKLDGKRSLDHYPGSFVGCGVPWWHLVCCIMLLPEIVDLWLGCTCFSFVNYALLVTVMAAWLVLFLWEGGRFSCWFL